MSKRATVMDVDHVLGVCQRRCADLGVSVEFDGAATTAYTNGHHIVFPVISHPVTSEALEILHGQVVHETGHHLRPQAFDILKAAQPPTHLMSLFNITEDDGMERERALEWKGDRAALCRMNSLLIEEAGKSWAEHFANQPAKGAPKQDPAPIASMVIGQLSRLEWDDESPSYVKSLISILPDPVKELVNELENEGWVGRFRATTTPTETWDLSVDLAKRLYPNDPEDLLEQIREAGHKGASDPSAKARDTKGDTFTADSEGMYSKGKSRSTDDEGEGRTISWRDVVVSEHGKWEANQKGGNLGITWEGRIPTGGSRLMPTNKVNVVDLSKVSARIGTYWHKYRASDAHSRAFANRVRRYLQAKGRSTVQRDKLSGKLDRASIVKLALPPIDGGEYNKKIFYDQRKHTMKDTAIFVLVDWSGSMGGRKMVYAADAAQRLVHTMERVLNIPVALALFSNYRTTCDVGYVKKFNTRGTTEDAIAKRFDSFKQYSSGNDDADAVHWAWHEIRKRKESRKLLIVLSDGAPTGSYMGHPDECLKLVTRSIEREGKVELYGVGICSKDVSSYYTNWCSVNNPKDINDTLFNLIKEGNNAR